MRAKDFYAKYMQAFLMQNSVVNLISKNDEKFLWEKHVFDSLAIEYFFKKYSTAQSDEKLTLLDIGTGGGFPALPIALTYPQLQVTALDSIRKKINAIENIRQELDISNLKTICERVENITGTFDIITSRAVASLNKICTYALPLLKKDGYFIAYKSRKTPEEIEDAEKVLKKYNSKVIDIIEYQLPLEENFTRNLIIIKN